MLAFEHSQHCRLDTPRAFAAYLDYHLRVAGLPRNLRFAVLACYAPLAQFFAFLMIHVLVP